MLALKVKKIKLARHQNRLFLLHLNDELAMKNDELKVQYAAKST